MIRKIYIKNLILIQEAKIDFENGFNVISGETGSGKSAIIAALGLLMGNRTDSSLIRSGEEKGCVEAEFELPQVFDFLNESGIETEDEYIVVKREISSNGKSRAWINNQSVQLSFLQKFSPLIVRIVGQHANQHLFDLAYHRNTLDLFGNICTKKFSDSWQKEKNMLQELEMFKKEVNQKKYEIEKLQVEWQELEEANLQPREEESLYEEYKKYTHSEELAQKAHQIVLMLSNEENSIIGNLNNIQYQFEKMLPLDNSLFATSEIIRNTTLELGEAANALQVYLNNIEFNPQRSQEINNRLAYISKLKRKYGKNNDELIVYKEEISKKLAVFENSDEHIEKLENELKLASEVTNNYAYEISEKRKKASQALEKEITKHLKDLNMSKAQFEIRVSAKERNLYGDDAVEYYLKPNVGEQLLPLCDCASGGELSRVMLALQTILAGKENIATLIFDEIDANIGGETAAAVAEKLKEIGKNIQIICITHFPQVAKQADYHLQISKIEDNGRTFTTVKPLDLKERQLELQRMSGNQA